METDSKSLWRQVCAGTVAASILCSSVFICGSNHSDSISEPSREICAFPSPPPDECPNEPFACANIGDTKCTNCHLSRRARARRADSSLISVILTIERKGGGGTLAVPVNNYFQLVCLGNAAGKIKWAMRHETGQPHPAR